MSDVSVRAFKVISCCMVALAMGIPGTVSAQPAQLAAPDRTAAIRGCVGTYSGAPRGKDGRVDVQRLLEQLKDLHANTYSWLIWTADTDWEDLQTFLPPAREAGIRVWVTLVPPSESPPKSKRFSEPFRLDYERWAVDIARLSVAHPNLVAWSIDDFTHNLAFFTPEKLRGIVAGARAINPKLAFVPCSYFPGVTAKFATGYAGSVDGVLFPYRHESNKANLTDASLLKPELARLRQLLGPGVTIIVDVYSTAHSRLGASTPDYVRDVLTQAREAADGAMVYCHPDPHGKDAAKYPVVREVFGGPAKR
jgi:hypothetical protein